MSPLRGLSLSPNSDIKIMELRETEKKLLTAVSTIIEEEGFTKLGVNHIARQAKCDKVLIYRYFGGLEGLLVAWAKHNDFYSFAYREFAERVAQAENSDIHTIVKEVLSTQVSYLRESHLMRELYIWELSGNSTFRAIQLEREVSGHKLQEELEKRLGNKCDDCKFYITIIIAAINYIVLFTCQYSLFNSIDFSLPECWKKLEKIISNYVDWFLYEEMNNKDLK